MTILHGILAELGLEPPQMHPEREIRTQSEWIVDQTFVPVQGKSYELAYGKISVDGEQRTVIKKIRADGLTPADWFDLDKGMPLDHELHAYPVKGFRQLA